MKRSSLVIAWLCVAALSLPSAGAAESAPSAVAKIASVENRVETRSGADGPWHLSVAKEELRGMDRVRTAAASRAAILYSDQTLHRLNEKSEIEIQAPKEGGSGVLRVLSGQHYFTSRTPRDYGRIETRTVTAAIRGTEFAVEVAADGATTITMIEGSVLAANELGSVSVTAGEQAFAAPGKAPERRVAVRPKDAVAWSFYYPRVVGGRDAERIASLGADGRSLAEAAEMLSSGQVSGARALVESALSKRPDEPIALALASVIAVARDETEEALRLAERAATADPESPAAALSLSYASQARFDVERARLEAERAARLDPKSSVALARAAELRMAEGDLDGARRAAEEAVERAPSEARALAVLGFVALAQRRTPAAESALERATAADPGLPLARLGLGIARFRRGRTAEALEELQTATALDPDDALARAYLGKAYYELRRSPEASKELERAKQADPLDPTPYLYEALVLQNENRPAEALDAVRASIERNDRRAVYRSRLLLDQDLAVRSADLARVYNDLGFEQPGLVAARRSADGDHANHSSHLFLSGLYRALPGLAPAFLSEVLQARIYQPVNVNAARPDVVGETSVSFNEYTALFDRPRTRAFAGGSWGATDKGLASVIPENAQCLGPGGAIVPCTEVVTLRESETWSGEALAGFNGERFTAAVGASRIQNDGFRVNNDREDTKYRGFFQWAPTWRDSVQLNVLVGRQERGDLPLRELPIQITPERFETDLTNIGVGVHRRVSAASDVAVSAIFNETEQRVERGDPATETTGRLRGPQLEVQHVLRLRRANWVLGAGGFDGTFRLESSAGAGLEDEDRFINAYAYARTRAVGPLEWTAGAAVESVQSPTGMLPPRDSSIGPAELGFSDLRLNPKLGATYFATPTTVVRAAGFFRTSPFLGRVQTLEPTQVAGFNQFYEEPGGTRSLSYGLGIDQEIGPRCFVGFELLRRDLTIPQPYCAESDPYSGCAGAVADSIVERDSTEDRATVYLNATIGPRVSAGIRYEHESREFDFTQVSPTGLFEDFVRTRRLRPEVRWFLPGGFFAVARGTRYQQRVDQFDDLTSPDRSQVKRAFWVGDLQAGFRFPGRWGSVVLEVSNASDREYDFFLPAVQDEVIPARRAVLRMNLTY